MQPKIALNQHGSNLIYKSSALLESWPELGSAQPQLVCFVFERFSIENSLKNALTLTIFELEKCIRIYQKVTGFLKFK